MYVAPDDLGKEKDYGPQKEKFCELLGYADITEGYKEYLWRNFRVSITFDLPLRLLVVNSRYYDNYAIFDDERVQER